MMIRIFFAAMLAMGFLQIAAAAEPISEKQVYAQWIDENSDDTVTFAVAKTIVEQAHKHAERANIDPLLVLAIIKAESGYRHKVGNRYGARGLMQVVPRFHADKIANRNILGISTNIEVGVAILKDCVKSVGNNVYKAMRCYSGGAGKKYMKNISTAYTSLARAMVAWRFKKELPIHRENRWGVVLLPASETTLLAANLN